MQTSDSELDYDPDEKAPSDSDLEAILDPRSDSDLTVSSKLDYLEVLEANLEHKDAIRKYKATTKKFKGGSVGKKGKKRRQQAAPHFK